MPKTLPMPLDAAAAAHLLRRVGWAPSTAEVAAFVGLERVDAVDAVLHATPPAVVPPPDLGREQQWWAQFDTVAWWVQRMMTTPAPLVERMTLFWHGHFCSAQEKVYDMEAMFRQNQIFRTHALGDFREMAQQVAIDPAMLVYLDNETNRAGAEQENFARELMELFTIGVGQFTEADVIAMAKAWTGHNTVGWNGTFHDTTYVFKSNRHDNGDKTLFGITRNWDGPETIDEMCFGVRAVALSRFIARKVFSFLAHTAPSDTTVDALATTFRNADLDIGALVRAVLLHDDFWAPVSRYALVKSPTDFVVSTLRCLGLPAADAGLLWSMDGMGQTLFDPPNVAGWKQNRYWISTATTSARGKWLEFLRWRLQGGFFDGLQNQANAAVGVQTMLDRFRISDVEQATRARLEQWFTTTRTNHRWALAFDPVVVVALTPDFQVM